MSQVIARRGRKAHSVEEQYTEAEAAKKLAVCTRTMFRRREARLFTPAPWLDNGVWKYSATTLINYIEARRAYKA